MWTMWLDAIERGEATMWAYLDAIERGKAEMPPERYVHDASWAIARRFRGRPPEECVRQIEPATQDLVAQGYLPRVAAGLVTYALHAIQRLKERTIHESN